MHSEKKITKEDTWRPADLRRYIKEKSTDDGYTRRRDDSERKHRGGESMERRHRDPEESRRDRDKLRERDSTRERRYGDDGARHTAQRKEDSQDLRDDKSRDRRDHRDRKDGKDRRDDRERKRLVEDDRGNRERRPDKDTTGDKERHRDKYKDKEKERVKERERYAEEERDKRREDRHKERRREERDKEHRSERRLHEESGKERDESEKQQREQRDRRHRDSYEDKRKDRDTQERHGDRKHSEQKDEREYREHRRPKEERDRRHKHHEEKRKHESESREHWDMKTSGASEGFSRGGRDRAERDERTERRKKEEEDADRRHKERRHKEEDTEKNQREKTDSKMASSDKSQRFEKEEETKDVEFASEQRTADVNDEDDAEGPVDLQVKNDDEQEYEDDFEDYEDDFEEVDESADEKEELAAQRRKEIEAIRRAMAEENERAGMTQPRLSTSREEDDGSKGAASSDFEKNQAKTSQHGKFINFVAAKQREVSRKVATKQKERSAELLRLIDLDFSVTSSLLDLPPVTEYEMYIRNFGNANTKQEYVQCHEDNSDRDVQTEEIDTCEKWTQHPPEHTGACGDPNFSQEALDKTRSEIQFDSQRLISFLHSASQVMVVLLEEDEAERKSLRKLNTQTESLSFSDGSLQLNTKMPFLLGRQISLVHFSQVQRHTMLSVHTPTGKAGAVRLDSSTIICIWNIWEPSRPQKILLYEAEVQCCCFSPGKSTLVFAGTSVGSVVLWDLRELASNHCSLQIGEDEWTFRHPTFSTDAVMAGSGHFSSVTSVEVVPFTVSGGLSSDVPLLASEEELSGLSFQLASLDESGVLNFWVVLELSKANEAGSPTDLGLRPGGKVKLLHSSSLLTADRASPRDAAKTRPLQTLLLKFLPTDSNHFFIGTNLGLVSHGTSHGLKAPPKFYRFQEVEERPVDISSIHFSPFRPHLFLVGCGDGSIRLHAVSRDQPVAEWRSSTAGETLVSLQWAQTRPTVFCALDAASNLYIWDLLKSDAQPVVTESMKADRVTAMSVFGDSGQQTYAGVALAHESGNIELHYFSTSFTVSSSAEEGKLESLLTEAF